MPRRVVIVIGVLGVFLAIVFMVALRRTPPDIPADARHLESVTDAQACLKCHGPGGSSPRTPNHPLGNQCWGCHYRAGEAR
jgi:cytochrome c553